MLNSDRAIMDNLNKSVSKLRKEMDPDLCQCGGDHYDTAGSGACDNLPVGRCMMCGSITCDECKDYNGYCHTCQDEDLEEE